MTLGARPQATSPNAGTDAKEHRKNNVGGLVGSTTDCLQHYCPRLKRGTAAKFEEAEQLAALVMRQVRIKEPHEVFIETLCSRARSVLTIRNSHGNELRTSLIGHENLLTANVLQDRVSEGAGARL